MKTALIVSNDRIAHRLSEILQRKGYRTSTSSRPVDGFNQALRLRPSVMVIQWKLGDSGYDGLELLFVIRQEPMLKEIPALLIVPGNPWYRVDEFLASLPFGPDDFICTPFTPEELLPKLSRLIIGSNDQS